ncbi:MAG: hypothetical protein WCO09_01950 [bacterium]
MKLLQKIASVLFLFVTTTTPSPAKNIWADDDGLNPKIWPMGVTSMCLMAETVPARVTQIEQAEETDQGRQEKKRTEEIQHVLTTCIATIIFVCIVVFAISIAQAGGAKEEDEDLD